MNKGKLLSILCAGLIVAGCVTDERSYWDLKQVDDSSQLNVTFGAESGQYQRIQARRSRHEDGWVESGTWVTGSEQNKTTVWIYLATLYGTKAFSKKNVLEMKVLAENVSGDSYLEFGEQGKFRTNTGDVEYIFYRASGQPCGLIRKYWTDPQFAGDVNRAIALDWVAGTNFIYAYQCKLSGPDLDLPDLDLLFNGIEAKALYWPDDMFISADDPF